MSERASSIYKAVKARTITYSFPPGKRVLLCSLAEELGTSTHQVREALLALVGEGWVNQAPNKEFLATEPNLAAFAECA